MGVEGRSEGLRKGGHDDRDGRWLCLACSSCSTKVESLDRWLRSLQGRGREVKDEPSEPGINSKEQKSSADKETSHL